MAQGAASPPFPVSWPAKAGHPRLALVHAVKSSIPGRVAATAFAGRDVALPGKAGVAGTQGFSHKDAGKDAEAHKAFVPSLGRCLHHGNPKHCFVTFLRPSCNFVRNTFLRPQLTLRAKRRGTR